MEEPVIRAEVGTELNGLTGEINRCFRTKSSRETARKYLLGLLGSAERKNGWQMSEQMGETTPYKIQQFLYRGRWNADEVRDCLYDYVTDKLGAPEGVLVMDETGFLKQGTKSAGVKRQYSGTAGRIENCQIGVFLTYAASKGYTILDRELYIPQEWAADKERCRAAGIPEECTFRTKPEMALEMIERADAAGIPYTWVTGDCVYGEYYRLRQSLEANNKGYVVAVSGKACVWMGCKQIRISDMTAALPEDGWTRLSVGNGTKGERLYDWMLFDINTPSELPGQRKLLFRRNISRPDDICAYLCYSPESVGLAAFAGVAAIRWTVEMCFAESKGEVGLDHYEVRSYQGWYNHITMVCLAHALLTVLKTLPVFAEVLSEILSDMPADSLSAFKRGRGL